MTIYYLYIKTHNITGLKYLGQTKRQDPHKYHGSGKYWNKHLRVHGYDYQTEIIKECQTADELEKWGVYYSDLYNVVQSKLWANLIPENGCSVWGKLGMNPMHFPDISAKITGVNHYTKQPGLVENRIGQTHYHYDHMV